MDNPASLSPIENDYQKYQEFLSKHRNENCIFKYGSKGEHHLAQIVEYPCSDDCHEEIITNKYEKVRIRWECRKKETNVVPINTLVIDGFGKGKRVRQRTRKYGFTSRKMIKTTPQQTTTKAPPTKTNKTNNKKTKQKNNDQNGLEKKQEQQVGIGKNDNDNKTEKKNDILPAGANDNTKTASASIPLSSSLGVGYEFSEFFESCGWYKGTVIKVESNAIRRCKFSDGVVEDRTVQELENLREEPRLGEVGFEFCKKWQGVGIFNAKVQRITPTGKCVCLYDDGDSRTYSPSEIEKFVKMTYGVVTSDTDSSTGSGSGGGGHSDSGGSSETEDSDESKSSDESNSDNSGSEKSVPVESDDGDGSSVEEMLENDDTQAFQNSDEISNDRVEYANGSDKKGWGIGEKRRSNGSGTAASTLRKTTTTLAGRCYRNNKYSTALVLIANLAVFPFFLHYMLSVLREESNNNKNVEERVDAVLRNINTQLPSSSPAASRSSPSHPTTLCPSEGEEENNNNAPPTPDGYFIHPKFPVFHRKFRDGFHSNANCVGETFHPTESWKHRSCSFRNLCFDVDDKVFVLFQSEEQEALNRALANVTRDEIRFHHNAASSITNYAFHDPATGGSGGGGGVSLGGLNPRWQGDTDRLKWYPTVRRVKASLVKDGYYTLGTDRIMVPWHSMAGQNPGHLVWDDFLPIYTLLSMFDLLDKNGGELVLVRYVLEKNVWASCQTLWKRCEPMLKKFLPLLGTQLEETSNQTAAELVLHNNNNNNDIGNEEEEEQRNGRRKSKYVCAPHGVAGMGMLTDHGSKMHGYEIRDYESVHNVGRGGEIYRFRNWMVDHLAPPTRRNAAGNQATVDSGNCTGGGSSSSAAMVIPSEVSPKPPYRIVLSHRSSDRRGRIMSFDRHAKALKERLGKKYELDVVGAKFSRMSVEEQVRVVAGASVLVTVCGGGAITGMFLPRGSSLVVYYNDDPREELGPNERLAPRFDVPSRLDWDLLNNMGHVRVHWLPRPRSTFKTNEKDMDADRAAADMEAFVRLIDHELDLVSHRDSD